MLSANLFLEKTKHSLPLIKIRQNPDIPKGEQVYCASQVYEIMKFLEKKRQGMFLRPSP